MIVRETSSDGEREFELNREHLAMIRERTGLDETAIYTILNSGKQIEDAKYCWILVRQ
jgi:hypothetical protein